MLARACEFAGPFAPCCIGLIKINRCLERRWHALAAGSDPAGNCVFADEILGSRGPDGFWRRKAITLPVETTFNHPAQYTSPFRFKLFGQFRIAFLRRDRHREWHQVKPTTDRLV